MAHCDRFSPRGCEAPWIDVVCRLTIGKAPFVEDDDPVSDLVRAVTMSASRSFASLFRLGRCRQA
jgi:hypothetical protein